MNTVFSIVAQILFALFLVGLVGSFVVIVITFIEDLELLFDGEVSANEVC